MKGKDKKQYIVDEKDRKIAVILPIKEYEELLEDLHDLAVVAERRDESTVSFEEVKARLEPIQKVTGLSGQARQ